MIPNQTEILTRLAEVSRLLDKATLDVATLDEAHVRAKQTHEVAWSRAYLKADGSIDTRKAQATLATEDTALAVELAAVQLRACRERIRTLGSQLDVGRTLSAAVRTQFAAEPAGQTT